MKFSIVTITYNRAKLIADTIQSVIAQDFSDFEHIIIDDGSTDETETVVSSFNDPRIRYFRFPHGNKRSFLRNEGIRKSQGENICILDSDDIWMSNKLSRMKAILETHPDVDFIFHNIEFQPERTIDGPLFPYSQSFKGSIFKNLLADKILPFPVFTITRKALDKIGLFDERLTDGQHDLYLRAASQLIAFFETEKLTVMRKHGQNISDNINFAHYDDFIVSLEKLRGMKLISAWRYREQLSRVYGKNAYIYMNDKKLPAAKKFYGKSFLAAPASIRGLKSAFMCLSLYLKGAN